MPVTPDGAITGATVFFLVSIWICSIGFAYNQGYHDGKKGVSKQ